MYVCVCVCVCVCVALDACLLCVSEEWPLANVESILQDATALLGTIQSPSLDTLPKYQVKPPLRIISIVIT